MTALEATKTEENSNERIPEPEQTPATALFSIFDRQQKALIVLLISVAATFSGFASNPYFPAIPTIAEDLSVSVELVTLTVTSYLIFQGLAPSLWGPISDVKGRRVAYLCTFCVFLGANIGLAQTRNYATLIVLRCLQSTGSASTIAIGGGVIGDITTRADRGGFMGIFQAGMLAPTAIGPVIGGAIAGSLGWRAIFWFLVIYAGIFLCFLVVLLPETLRSTVGNGSRTPKNIIGRFPLRVYQRTTKVAWTETPASDLPPKKSIDVFGPLHMLFSKQAAPIIIFLAVQFTAWQMCITAMSTLFESRYDLSVTQIGLTFIANGTGSMIGTLVTGKILDIEYARIQKKVTAKAQSESQQIPKADLNDSTFPLERARLRLMPAFCVIQMLSILVFGWTIQYPQKVPIAIPIISTFFVGWFAVSMQMAVTTYLVDIFSDRSAAANASLNLARCLMAAGGTSIIIPLINAIGVGWAFTVCIGIQALSLVGVFVQWRFAGKWRQDAAARKEAS